ncbi:recombinase family protein [Acetivibrio ethanolgignens]|nr:recombinase family protein [Acetivibrio ethanolgignens]
MDTETAAVYVRISTDLQGELSPESQLDKAMEYAKSNSYYIPKEYIFMELGVSGRKADKRPQFQRMIALAKLKDHPIDTILVWKFSRFARN